MSRRRLSGAPAPLTVASVAEVAAENVAPAPGGRKSFGMGYRSTAREVQPVVGTASLSTMYSTIIKLSAENKINVKNSWSLPLIDHMEQLVLSGGAPGGTRGAAARDAAAAGGGTFGGRAAPAPPEMLNFQRASCALDASIKIYSARVDDVYSSSFRVLER